MYLKFIYTYIGFICPVHTPDGTPCGLLNHLTMNCIVTKHPDPKLRDAIPSILLDLGMLPMSIADDWTNSYTVMLDGKVVGLIEDNIVARVVDKLRVLKINEKVSLNRRNYLVIDNYYSDKSYCIIFFIGTTNNGNRSGTKKKCDSTISWCLSLHRTY